MKSRSLSGLLVHSLSSSSSTLFSAASVSISNLVIESYSTDQYFNRTCLQPQISNFVESQPLPYQQLHGCELKVNMDRFYRFRRLIQPLLLVNSNVIVVCTAVLQTKV